MELEYVLKWMVGLGSLFALTHGPRSRGWVAVLAGLLGLLAIGELLNVSGTGYVLGVLWLVLAAIPMSASRRQVELISQNRIREAAFWARVNAWLHPFDGWPEQALWFRARAKMDQGELEQARQLLERLAKKPRFKELAKLERLRLDGDFAGIVRHVETKPIGTRDLNLAALYLQALGETGDTDSMLRWFGRLPTALRGQPLFRLRVAAYAGQIELLEEAAGSEHLVIPSQVLDYARGIARQVAGDTSGARPFLERAQTSPAVATQALKRLRRPLPAVIEAELSLPAHAGLVELQQQAAWERARLPQKERRPLATWALSACFVLIFFVGLPGGTTNHDNLIEMGALILPEHLAPGAWRLLTAGFVHFGATHLGMNVLGLLFLGGVVERVWGRLPLLVCFLAGSIGAYWLATFVITASEGEPKVLLGASAGVFGLVGGLVAFEVLGGLYGRIKLLSRRLLILSLLVLAQLVFDWFTPIVSSFLHLSGVACGAVAALPFAVYYWRPKLRNPPSRLERS